MSERQKTKNISQSPWVWSFTTYFAEGLPYTIIRTLSSFFFRDKGVSLEAIGLTSLFGIPWILKFLWGPYVDQYATKRGWMICMQFFLSLMSLCAAFFSPIPDGLKILAVLFFVGAFFAATNDIAIDGYYMEALDKTGQARFVGYRVMAYRLAMMTGTGLIATIGATVNWMLAFLMGGVLLSILFLYHFFLLPKVEQEKLPARYLIKNALRLKPILGLSALILIFSFLRWLFTLEWYNRLLKTVPILAKISLSGWIGIGLLMVLIILGCLRSRIKSLLMQDRESFYSKAFLTYIDREKMGVVLAFIILMRTGEFMLGSMVSPFIVDLGIKIHYGWISAGVGLPCSIVGALFGGWMISKFSLKKMIWPFLLAQNLTNIFYMLVALLLSKFILLNTGAENSVPIGFANLILVSGMHGFDQFAGGLGTAVLTTFLMRTCLVEFKAAHFAIGTGLMSVSGVIAGVMSGFLAQWLGYGYFFGITFLLSLPGMALIFFLPFLEEEK